MIMPAATKMRTTLPCLLAIVILAAWLRAPGLTEKATFMDEGFRISMAQPIARGQALYRDVEGAGPPGAILFNAAILALSKESIVAVRVSYLIISLLSLCAVFGIAYAVSGLAAATIAGLLVATSPWDVYYSYHAMTEPLMSLFSLLAVLAVISNSCRACLGRFFIAGALGALSVMVKQPGAMVLVGIAIAELISGFRRGTQRAALANVAALAAGAATTIAIWSIWALAHDSWGIWFREMTGYTIMSSSQFHQLMNVPNNNDLEKWTSLLTSYAARRLFIPIGIFSIIVLPFMRRSHPTDSSRMASPNASHLLLISTLTIGFSLFTYLLPQSYNGGLSHYLLMAEPWWILLASCFVAAVIHRIRAADLAKTWDWVALLFFPALVATAGLVGPDHFRDLVKWRDANGEPSRSLRWERGTALRLVSSRRPLIMTNPIYYFHLGQFPPGSPLNYGLAFDVLILNLVDPDRADKLIATALSGCDMVLVDPKRQSILFDSLERAELPFSLELISRRETLHVYSVTALPQENP